MVKNPELVVKHWLEQSKEDLKSAEALLFAHRYTWCAFICQQAIEKILKAGYVSKNKTIPPHIHKLERLCQLLDLNPPADLSEDLVIIDKYYIASRYPSYIDSINIKTAKQAETLLKKTKGLYKWTEEKLKLTGK